MVWANELDRYCRSTFPLTVWVHPVRTTSFKVAGYFFQAIILEKVNDNWFLDDDLSTISNICDAHQ